MRTFFMILAVFMMFFLYHGQPGRAISETAITALVTTLVFKLARKR